MLGSRAHIRSDDLTPNRPLRKSDKGTSGRPHAAETGMLEVKGVKRAYKLTKPLPQKGVAGQDQAVCHFAGVLELEGKSAVAYSITRFNYGDYTESFISVNGNKGRVVRDPLPKDVTYEGTVEVQVPQPFSYKVKQTIRRGETALECEDLEG